MGGRGGCTVFLKMLLQFVIAIALSSLTFIQSGQVFIHENIVSDPSLEVKVKLTNDLNSKLAVCWINANDGTQSENHCHDLLPQESTILSTFVNSKWALRATSSINGLTDTKMQIFGGQHDINLSKYFFPQPKILPYQIAYAHTNPICPTETGWDVSGPTWRDAVRTAAFRNNLTLCFCGEYNTTSSFTHSQPNPELPEILDGDTCGCETTRERERINLYLPCSFETNEDIYITQTFDCPRTDISTLGSVYDPHFSPSSHSSTPSSSLSFHQSSLNYKYLRLQMLHTTVYVDRLSMKNKLYSSLLSTYGRERVRLVMPLAHHFRSSSAPEMNDWKDLIRLCVEIMMESKWHVKARREIRSRQRTLLLESLPDHIALLKSKINSQPNPSKSLSLSSTLQFLENLQQHPTLQEELVQVEDVDWEEGLEERRRVFVTKDEALHRQLGIGLSTARNILAKAGFSFPSLPTLLEYRTGSSSSSSSFPSSVFSSQNAVNRAILNHLEQHLIHLSSSESSSSLSLASLLPSPDSILKSFAPSLTSLPTLSLQHPIFSDASRIKALKAGLMPMTTEFLASPALIQGYKLNMRRYLLAVCVGGRLRGYVHDDGKNIFTRDPYREPWEGPGWEPTSETTQPKTKDYYQQQVELRLKELITTGYVPASHFDDKPMRGMEFFSMLAKGESRNNVSFSPRSDMDSGVVDYSPLQSSMWTRLALSLHASRTDPSREGFDLCSTRPSQTKQEPLPYCIEGAIRFQHFGCDFHIDKELSGYNSRLFECNKGPDFSIHSYRDGVLKRDVAADMLSFMGFHGEFDGSAERARKHRMNLIYDSEWFDVEGAFSFLESLKGVDPRVTQTSSPLNTHILHTPPPQMDEL